MAAWWLHGGCMVAAWWRNGGGMVELVDVPKPIFFV